MKRQWPYHLAALSVGDWVITAIILTLGGREVNPIAAEWFDTMPLAMFLMKCVAIPLIGVWAWGESARARTGVKVVALLHVPVLAWNFAVLGMSL